MGINGAGIATLIATVGYSVAKLVVVQLKFKMQPFTSRSLKAFVIIMLFCGIFYFWDFNINPFIAILLKGSIIGVSYIMIVYMLKVSNDVNEMMYNAITRLKKML